MRKPSPPQIKLMNKVADFNREHPNWFFSPNDTEWRSVYPLYETGLLEPVNCGTREQRVHRHGYMICKTVPDTRVRLTNAGRKFLADEKES